MAGSTRVPWRYIASPPTQPPAGPAAEVTVTERICWEEKRKMVRRKKKINQQMFSFFLFL